MFWRWRVDAGRRDVSLRGAHVIRSEANVREALRDVRIPNPVARPYPTAGILCRKRFLVSIEARKIHAPDVTIPRRQCAVVGFCQPLHPLPRECEFNGP